MQSFFKWILITNQNFILKLVKIWDENLMINFKYKEMRKKSNNDESSFCVNKKHTYSDIEDPDQISYENFLIKEKKNKLKIKKSNTYEELENEKFYN